MPEMNSIQHVNVMVDDLAAADAFYADLLDLEHTPTPELGFPAQFYKVNDSQEIHVNQLEDVRPERSHFCLRVSNFNSVFGRARDLGCLEVKTWGKARRLPTGVMQAFVRDPSGNLVEISCEADQSVDASIFDLDFVDSETRFFRQPD